MSEREEKWFTPILERRGIDNLWGEQKREDSLPPNPTHQYFLLLLASTAVLQRVHHVYRKGNLKSALKLKS